MYQIMKQMFEKAPWMSKFVRDIKKSSSLCNSASILFSYIICWTNTGSNHTGRPSTRVIFLFLNSRICDLQKLCPEDSHESVLTVQQIYPLNRKKAILSGEFIFCACELGHRSTLYKYTCCMYVHLRFLDVMHLYV